MKRNETRELAYQLVFEYMFNPDNDSTSKNMMFMLEEKLSDNDKAYIDKMLDVIHEHYDELKAYIAQFVTNFDVDRLFKADLAVLLLAVAEIKYFDDIPVGVSIDEAVELSKKYSVENGYKFVNGVLGAISKDIKEN